MAIIGDVGGHADQLARCLAQLGVSATEWPDALTVVQVGDLLGGVDDQAVVAIVEPHLVAGRWVQLLGNWDSRALGGWWFSSPTRGEPDPDAEERIAAWYAARFATHAVAITTNGGATAVVTHAGVTAPFWRQALDGTRDPIEATERINALPVEVVHQPGRMLGIDTPTVESDTVYVEDVVPPPVGPIWADTDELWSGWYHIASPWPQVHGHTSAWFRNDWSEHAPAAALPYATRNRQLRHTRYMTGKGTGPPLLGIDCSVWASNDLVLHPLVIPNAQVAAGVEP